MSKRTKDIDTISAHIKHRIEKGLTELIDPSEIYALFPKTSETTTKGKIKDAMDQNFHFVGLVASIFPRTETILNATEKELGSPVVGETLVQANKIAKKLVDTLTNSFIKKFCESSLGNDFDKTTDKISTSFQKLNSQLLIPYKEYLTQLDSAIVSIAGKLNQSLFVRALRNSGFSDEQKNRTFSETGKKSEGDIKIYHVGTGKGGNKILNIEAKSYAARERLLRGLTDIQNPKVGVGFFNDPTEFSRARVQLLVTSAQAQAVYMPLQTYTALTAEAKKVAHTSTGRVCRILESEFTQDMTAFKVKGEIPYINPHE